MIVDLPKNIGQRDQDHERKTGCGPPRAKRAADAVPISRDSIDGVNCINLLAEVYSMTDEPEAALYELEKIIGLPNGPTYGDLRFNPGWDQFRKDARFTKILSQAVNPPAID